MEQFIFASLSNTHYWYEVGMLKVPAVEKTRKNGFGPFSYKFFVCIRVGLIHTIYRCTGYCIKLKVLSTKPIVFQNIITVVPLWNRFSPPDLSLYRNVYRLYKIYYVSKHYHSFISILLWQRAVIL